MLETIEVQTLLKQHDQLAGYESSIQQVKSLNESILGSLPISVSKPIYDRSQVGTAWIHFGTGNFHRAHQAVYAHDLFQAFGPTEWGICGIGFFQRSLELQGILQQQDFLYTLLEQGEAYSSLSVIGSLKEFVYAPQQTQYVIEKLASPNTKLVSLTVTEKGYHTHGLTGDLNFDQEQVKYDLEHIDNPKYTYGFLVAGLRKRFQKNLKPFTIMSCDNMHLNGHVIKKAVLQFCMKIDPSLHAWLNDYGAFPNTMVDRIAPSYDIKTQEEIMLQYGINDLRPVVSEPFTQWVVEDNFSLGRPKFEKVGVQIVKDVQPYEKMKLNILNLGHSAVAYYGVLAGISYVHEAMKDKRCLEFYNYLIDNEVGPITPTVPEISVQEYKDTIIKRFQNSAIADTLQRICMDGSGKIPKFVIQPIQDILDSGKAIPIKGLILVVAFWIKYLIGKNDFGVHYDIEDAIGSQLQTLAQQCGRNPYKFVQQKSLFKNLDQNNYFVQELTYFIKELYQYGSVIAMDRFLTQQKKLNI